MPLSLKFYGVNLYSMNSLGQQWLDQSVTLSSFRGPPLVLVNYVINDLADANLNAVAEFADYWNAPLIGYDTTVGVVSWNTISLFNACQTASKFFTASHLTDYRLPYIPSDFGGSSTVPTTLIPALTGPWIALETVNNNPTKAAWSVLGEGFLRRTDQNHPYRCGMQGVSHFINNAYSGSFNAPPLYAIGSDGNVVGALSRLLKKWNGDAKPSVSQFEALGLAATLRPGLARLCNPALLPELVIAAPV